MEVGGLGNIMKMCVYCRDSSGSGKPANTVPDDTPADFDFGETKVASLEVILNPNWGRP